MMLVPRRPASRPAFTLLEVMLASALAVILMAALYVALEVQLRLADEGREAIEQATLTRALVQRFEADLASGIGPVTPPVGRSSSGSSAGGSAGGTGSGAGSASGSPAATASEDDDDLQLLATAAKFQAGVIGESDGDRPRLTIFVARVTGLTDTGDGISMPNPADCRRVTYWMTDWGLARQELPWITSDELLNSTEPVIEDGKEERDYVIAEEVVGLEILYWDGSAFVETWDGRETNADGQTLKGPPMAIQIRFRLRVPGVERGEWVEKEFRHTIAVRSAPGPAVVEAPTSEP